MTLTVMFKAVNR